MSHAEHILSTARALAQLDVTVSLATVAVEKVTSCVCHCTFNPLKPTQQYCRPVLVPEPVFRVQSGVHPLVESHQRANHFVTNDCIMDDHRLWIVTGPNMGGRLRWVWSLPGVVMVTVRQERVLFYDRMP